MGEYTLMVICSDTELEIIRLLIRKGCGIVLFGSRYTSFKVLQILLK